MEMLLEQIFHSSNKADNRIDDYIRRCIKYLSAMNCVIYNETHMIGTLDEWLDILEPTFGVVKYEKPTHFFNGKYIVDLGEECGGRQEFITVYDMIQHLQEYLPQYDGRVVVTGQFTRDWYAKKKMYLMAPAEGSIKLHLDQRVFMRAGARFFSEHGCFNRGYGKTFLFILL